MSTMPPTTPDLPVFHEATSRPSEAVAMQNGHVGDGTVAEEVANMVCSLGGLDASTIDRATNFADLGFNSLVLAQLGSRIRKQLGVRVPLADMLEPTLTIDSLARRLEPDVEALARTERVPVAADPTPPPHSQVVARPVPAGAPAGNTGHGGPLPVDEVAALIAEQLQVMERQLEVLALLAGAGSEAEPGD